MATQKKVNPKEWEEGLEAYCWFCDQQFTKSDYCKKCGYFKCPHCGKCACNLTKRQKTIVDRSFAALAPILTRKTKN